MNPSPGPQAATPRISFRFLAVLVIALSCTAPWVTFLARSSGFPRELFTIFDRLFAFNDFIHALAMLGALALALLWPGLRRVVARLALWMGEHPLQAAAVAFVAFAAGARWVYLAHPLSMDEYAAWMQANALVRGQWAVHYPPGLLDAIVPLPFQNYFLIVNHANGTATSAYWPGLALLMAPLAGLGLAWCLNPLLSAVALWLIHRVATDAAKDAAAGGWAMLAALASPQFTVNAMSYYAMPGELALNLLFLYLLLKPGLRSAYCAGLVGGLALVMHNPVPHALMAAPCLLWLAWDRSRWLRLLAVLAGYVPLGLGIGIGWWVFKSGFGDAPALPGAVHGGIANTALAILSSVLEVPTDAMLLARWYAGWKVWIWACPGLLLLMLPLTTQKRSAAERLLIAAFVLTFAFYLFVHFDQGHGWGYRYIHPVWAAVPIVAGVWLASRGLRLQQYGAAALAAGLLATPVFLWQTRQVIEEALSYRLAPAGPGDWLVFVSLDTGPYRGDLVQNPPGQTHRLFLVSHGDAQDRALVARYFPQARRELADDRGSAWRVPDGSLSHNELVKLTP